MNRFDNIFLDRMFISKYEPKLASVEDEPLITNQSLSNPLQSIVLIIIDEKTIDSLHKTTLLKILNTKIGIRNNGPLIGE